MATTSSAWFWADTKSCCCFLVNLIRCTYTDYFS